MQLMLPLLHRLGVEKNDPIARNILQHGVTHGNVDLVVGLIQAEVNLHARDSNGNIPLMLAILGLKDSIYERGEVYRMLLGHGASVTTKNEHGDTA